MKTFLPKSQAETQQARHHPTSRNSGSTSAFSDNRPEAIAQRKLQAMMHQSPQVQHLTALQARIDNSPQQVAERKRFERMFGPTVQRQEGLEEELQMNPEPGTIQQQSREDEELVQGKMESVQWQEKLEDEELGQGKFGPVQRQDEEEELLQGNLATTETTMQPENRTGMPDDLKAGIENLSGMSMDAVKVHYNSSKPAQLNVLAYTQGTDIHVGPGQEQHLAHEGWHVVQQQQGRVKPTMQAKGVSINDEGLEHEADVMGLKALQMRQADPLPTGPAAQATIAESREHVQPEAAEVSSSDVGASGKKVRLHFLSISKRRAQYSSTSTHDAFADKPFTETATEIAYTTPTPAPQHSCASITPHGHTQPSTSSPIQAKLDAPVSPETKPNATGLPDTVKAGVETLSGHSLDDVRVRYNASQPAQLGALAYAQGTDIYVAPAQATAHRLAHEAWHVAQQKQGRVAPTTSIQGAALNIDVGLEREADTMGTAALHTGLTGRTASNTSRGSRLAVPMTLPGITAPIMQGDFPDAYNDPRKDSQKTAAGNSRLLRTSVKLDHMVSQKNLRLFAGVYKVLDSLTNHSRSKWKKTQEALTALRKETPDPTANQTFFSEGHLVNMPNNIVPGLDNEIQGAKDNFDPQSQVTNPTGNISRVEQTALSRSQFAMDSAIRVLNQLVGSAKDILPSGSIASQHENYDSKLDDDIAAQLDIITNAMTTMKQAEEPIYNPNMWYTHQGSNVKKRQADWFKDKATAAATIGTAVGTTPAPAHGAWVHPFTFTVMTISNEKGRIKKLPVNVNVTVSVLPGAWTHIYVRHYLPTFGGTIEAVNTFWKTDPHTYLTNPPGTTLLETELRLILERSFSFYKAYANVEIGEEENASWSRGADKFFFQGNAKSEVNNKDEDQGIDYDVTVLLKSIAPQDPAHAYALQPDKL